MNALHAREEDNKYKDWYYNFLIAVLGFSIFLDGKFTWYGMTFYDLPEGNPIWVYFIDLIGLVPTMWIAIIVGWVATAFLFWFRYKDANNLRLYYTIVALLIASRFLVIGGWAGLTTLGGSV